MQIAVPRMAKAADPYVLLQRQVTGELTELSHLVDVHNNITFIHLRR